MELNLCCGPRGNNQGSPRFSFPIEPQFFSNAGQGRLRVSIFCNRFGHQARVWPQRRATVRLPCLFHFLPGSVWLFKGTAAKKIFKSHQTCQSWPHSPSPTSACSHGVTSEGHASLVSCRKRDLVKKVNSHDEITDYQPAYSSWDPCGSSSVWRYKYWPPGGVCL